MSGRLQSWHKASRSSFVIASFATSFHRITSENCIVYYHIYTKAGAIVSIITLYSNVQSSSFTRSMVSPDIIASLKKKLQSRFPSSTVLVVRASSSHEEMKQPGQYHWLFELSEHDPVVGDSRRLPSAKPKNHHEARDASYGHLDSLLLPNASRPTRRP